jgi:hypothetical protein
VPATAYGQRLPPATSGTIFPAPIDTAKAVSAVRHHARNVRSFASRVRRVASMTSSCRWTTTCTIRTDCDDAPTTTLRLAPMAQSRLLVVAGLVVALLLFAIAIVYWVEPAHSLPSFFPGHESGSGHHHVKHGIAALVVGLAALAFAWFQSGSAARQARG